MGTPAIEFASIQVGFGPPARRVMALRGLDLVVQPGQVLGCVGANGAGKTTAMHVLLGFVNPTAGAARLLGEDVTRHIARARLGYLPEHPDTYRFLTGFEAVRFAGLLHGLRGARLKERVRGVLERTGMSAVAHRRIRTYSRGMLQRICLAQTVVHDPDVLILDEPTGGLDPLGRQFVRAMLDEWRAAGKTVFFSSHELTEVEKVCDRVAVMAAGRVVAEGPMGTLIRPGESLEQAFLRLVGDTSPGSQP